MTTLVDDAGARAAIRDHLDTTLIVEAAAGTGKTTELITRILRILETGRAAMKEIVAVTFTEKAAGELKLRLREELERALEQASDATVARRLEDALATLEEAHVNTIHGFCAELLRERPVEACVDPLFVVLTEPQADRLYARAFRAWLQDTLQSPPEGLRRALRRTSVPTFGALESSGPIDRLRGAGRVLAEWRDFPQPWTRPRFDRAGEIARHVEGLHRLAEITASASSTRDNLYLDTDAVRRTSRQIQLEQSFGQSDLDAWESRLVDLTRDRGFSRTRKGSGYKYGKTVNRSEVLAARDALFADLQQFRKDADADLAACLQQELAGATRRYQELKRASGGLDFTDLLARARDLISTNDEVRAHLQQKFSRIFVDEFQDTDPIQAEILLLLAGDVPGKLFIVGDPKQAIYRFRGTDVATYWDVKARLAAGGGRVLQLTTSYRSVPAIQKFVNAAFAAEMIEDAVTRQAPYIPLSPSRPDDLSQPSVVVLPVPKPYARNGPLRASGKAIDESLPDAVGAFIAWMVEKSGWTVAERQADGAERRVAVQPRHVAVLFRRFVSFGEDMTRPYIDAIEARGIPHLLVGGKAFHGREEVETIRAALAAIEWPDDELSVFATLKGSLFAIDDELLLEYRHRFKPMPFHPFRIPKELGGNSGAELALTGDQVGHLLPVAQALRLLQELHRARNYRPVADTIGRLLDETRAHVGFILRTAGEQALANVLHVAELARQYEANGGISFRGFIDELRSAAASEAAEAPILEEGSDGVRLMTVHKAKGLEFPVVILADLTCRMNRDDASMYLDTAQRLCAVKLGGWAPHELHRFQPIEVARDQAEGVRLAYVAATRARDLLVVPAIGDQPWEGGWFSPLNRAIYPPMASRRGGARGPGCPAFRSKDSVLHRPNEEPAGPATVSPGLHTFGEYTVMWWDPGALKLDEQPTFGVRREDLIVKDVPRTVVADGRTRYDAWQLARADARAAGAAPSLAVKTVREWSADDQSLAADTTVFDASAVTTVSIGDPNTAARPGGVRFGLLVHGILAQAPFGATRATLDDVAAIEARLLGLDDHDAQAAASVVANTFAHELLQHARAADARGACRRETPISWTGPDETMIEGIVDLAFEDESGWTVVDYKTDRDIAADGLDRYRRQVAVYVAAIAAATGRPAKGVLVRV
ncbi:MAG TPA: UvrD-helicase domain-containing protein [Vicinamibacterales bacterium]|nr:UvrD-helicase domain-containing protein [Vicinamibacterales bacterium]